eukprot:TRINITY_DN7954_c0_g1_i2.p2 TRINITY_DN7954_c0_g1~~TRINITY_DN7954_c0_g1_i2.p2  ORF type:complete len:203 (+),score=50.81 TRINITY_DN7954_c0_g1_i2:182-790(+)
MKLVHGWLADPDDKQTFPFISNLSYNRAVEISLGKIDAIAQDDGQKFEEKFAGLRKEVSEPVDKESQFIACQKFLQDNPTQLTFYGLSILHQVLEESSLNVLFRNNHFSVLHKRGGRLYVLVTDEAFLDIPQVVWEELTEVGGDTRYLDADFRLVNFNAMPANGDQVQQGGGSGAGQAQARRSPRDDRRHHPRQDDDDCTML